MKRAQQIYKLSKTRFTFALLMLCLTAFSLAGCVKGLFGKGASGAVSLPGDKIKVAESFPSTTQSPEQNPPEEVSLRGMEKPLHESTVTGSGMPVQLSAQAKQSGVSPAGNPEFSNHGELLTEDTEWFGEVEVKGVLTIAPQATLTIAPGTIVRFLSQASKQAGLPVLVVQGRIVANGSADKPIIFCSNQSDVKFGKWQGIVLLASEKKNLMENCRVEGAETGLAASFSSIVLKNSYFTNCRTGLRFQDSLFQISGGGAAKCELGLNLHDSEADIIGADFSRNRIGIALQQSSFSLSGTVISDNELEAVSAEESKVILQGNQFNKNGRGITLTSCEGLIAHNIIDKNMNYGISLSASRVKVNANEISRNSGIGIRVTDDESIAWGNSITDNGRYDMYNVGAEGYMAIGNWWGDLKTSEVAGRIYDKTNDPAVGRVFFIPILQRKPKVSE
jgi:hypothetical protein